MTKPIVKNVPAAKIYFIAQGDTYTFEGKEKVYDRSKISFAVAGVQGKTEITKDVFDALQDLLTEPEVQKKLKDWV